MSRDRHACITADADRDDDPNFLAGLEQRRERYIVAVRCDFAVAGPPGGPNRVGERTLRWSPCRRRRGA
ncbi:MAG TPA: hypothetical protein VKP69_30720 [Isosphaeraceae bacterium]|nr:hypothetical protein [Isosphaeraceae bacterium]